MRMYLLFQLQIHRLCILEFQARIFKFNDCFLFSSDIQVLNNQNDGIERKYDGPTRIGQECIHFKAIGIKITLCNKDKHKEIGRASCRERVKKEEEAAGG